MKTVDQLQQSILAGDVTVTQGELQLLISAKLIETIELLCGLSYRYQNIQLRIL